MKLEQNDANLHSSGILQNSNSSKNNGGTTDYYQIKPQWKQAQDIIEDRNMNFAQGNILKAAFCFNTERHGGTNYERELNKIIWFCNRELARINNLTEPVCKNRDIREEIPYTELV